MFLHCLFCTSWYRMPRIVDYLIMQLCSTRKASFWVPMRWRYYGTSCLQSAWLHIYIFAFVRIHFLRCWDYSFCNLGDGVIDLAQTGHDRSWDPADLPFPWISISHYQYWLTAGCTRAWINWLKFEAKTNIRLWLEILRHILYYIVPPLYRRYSVTDSAYLQKMRGAGRGR